MLESYFIRTSFRLVIIGPVWHLFSNFEMKRSKKCFWNILPSLRIPKCSQKITKNQKTEHVYFDLDPKRYLGRRYPFIGSMGYEGGGAKLKVQGVDSYPLNSYTCTSFLFLG